MENAPSRRNFLAAGLALPAAASASRSSGRRTIANPTACPAVFRRGAAVQDSWKDRLAGHDRGLRLHDHLRPHRDRPGRGHGYQLLRYLPQLPERAERAHGGSGAGRQAEGYLPGEQVSDNPKTGPGILAEIDTSLKELNTDHLDVWHLHGLSNPAEITDELVEAQRSRPRQQGKIRFVGVSTHNLPAIVDRVMEAKIEVVQPQYSFASAAELRPRHREAARRPAWA